LNPQSYTIMSSLCSNHVSEPTANDLECVNDYDKEMTCRLKHNSCHQYKLKINNEMCNFTSMQCECKLQVPSECSHYILTGLCIMQEPNFFKCFLFHAVKPKKPTIRSVKQTQNGDFRVTWDTHYIYPPFKDSLKIELNYSDKGGRHNVSRNYYDLVGSNLQPNSDYIITARAGSKYNNFSRFSDYSEPYEFSTPRDYIIIIKTQKLDQTDFFSFRFLRKIGTSLV
uniref:Fibronectin type-III domain-containing protein n=1 Tax=Astyanax mexicanus TaxID=7994 RepID=A0A8B9RET1_ASTMX